MVWYGMVWYGMVWYGMVYLGRAGLSYNIMTIADVRCLHVCGVLSVTALIMLGVAGLLCTIFVHSVTPCSTTAPFFLLLRFVLVIFLPEEAFCKCQRHQDNCQNQRELHYDKEVTSHLNKELK